ncbi:hydroxymethylglutaryl-CoA reductase, degradative [Furfurilactobacillus sp. WILCCON 0119]
MDKRFANVRNLTWQERVDLATEVGTLTAMQRQEVADSASEREALLIENYLTSYRLPTGLAAGIRLNGRDYMVPMVTEEPSVVAAASYGGKMTSTGQGMHGQQVTNLLMGQVVFQTVTVAEIERVVTATTPALLALADAAHPSIKRHGGGAKRLAVRGLGEGFVSVDLFVDTGAAMGANVMNSMLEALGHHLQDVLKHHPVMAILANDGQANVVTMTATVPVADLAKGNATDGLAVAQRIEAASRIAQLDVSRATTHNKGLMNGVDAVVMATGNDWRAVEASAHAYAARDGQYRGLSQWQVVGNELHGRVTMPMHLGLVGGATASLPLATVNRQVVDVTTVSELNQVAVAVGLAQNLAALRALVSEGIQQGHMRLQYRNLAVAAGATVAQVPLVVTELQEHEHPSAALATAIVARLNKTESSD